MDQGGHSDLASLFGNKPPALPASEIRRGAAYLLALVPLWGTVVQAVVSAAYANRFGFTPRDMFEDWTWLIPFFVVNGILAGWDERNLKKGGLRLRGFALLGAFLVPFYLLASGFAVRRHSARRSWTAYLPLLLWLLTFAAAVLVNPLVFNPDAPVLFNPDQWF